MWEPADKFNQPFQTLEKVPSSEVWYYWASSCHCWVKIQTWFETSNFYWTNWSITYLDQKGDYVRCFQKKKKKKICAIQNWYWYFFFIILIIWCRTYIIRDIEGEFTFKSKNPLALDGAQKKDFLIVKRSCMGSFPWTDEKNKRCPHRLSKIPAPLTIAEYTVLHFLGFGKAKQNFHNTIIHLLIVVIYYTLNIFHTCLAHIFTVPETFIFSKMSTAAAQWRQTWLGESMLSLVRTGTRGFIMLLSRMKRQHQYMYLLLLLNSLHWKPKGISLTVLLNLPVRSKDILEKKRFVICLHSSCSDSC